MGRTKTASKAPARVSCVLEDGTEGVAARYDRVDMPPKAWAQLYFPHLAFTPEQIVAAAAERPKWQNPLDSPGIYFLQREGRICYIGLSKYLCGRITQHRRAQRPFDAVTVIAGVHFEVLADLEHAYVSAWEPPWNWGRTSGYFSETALLRDRLAAMSQDLICNQPEQPPMSPGSLQHIWEKLNA